MELAAEICDHYSDKELTIVHARDTLMERSHHKAIQYADKLLRKRCAEILCNEKVIDNEGDTYFTDKGKKIQADMAFLCTGISCNFEFMKENFSDKLNKRNQIQVNNFLQMEGYDNIFAAGDITDRVEEKIAQNAENHAAVVVQNIKALENKEKLHEYKSKPRIMVISLGKKNGIVTYKNINIGGFIPALLKFIVEWKTMRRYRG